MKMRIRKGDTVAVITGRHRGATAKVVSVLAAENRVVLEGLNLVKRHRRATRNEKGRIVERPMPIHASNVMPIDPKSGKPTRIGLRVEGGKKVRFARKSGEAI
ncbi:MAG TPA: 50S ribosomal protein L24 [Candidatus Paceibacterota bacterium]